jgi:chromosome segregation ATPase
MQQSADKLPENNDFKAPLENAADKMDQIAKDESMTDEEKKEAASDVLDQLDKEMDSAIDEQQKQESTSEQLKDQMQQAQDKINQDQQQQQQPSQSPSEQKPQDQQKPSKGENDEEKPPEPEEEKEKNEASDGTGMGAVNEGVWDPYDGNASVEDFLNNNQGHINNQLDQSKGDNALTPEEQEIINNYFQGVNGWGTPQQP